jgi:hypothetical protein
VDDTVWFSYVAVLFGKSTIVRQETDKPEVVVSLFDLDYGVMPSEAGENLAEHSGSISIECSGVFRPSREK